MRLNWKSSKFLLSSILLSILLTGCSGYRLCVSGCSDGKIFEKGEDVNIFDNLKYICKQYGICKRIDPPKPVSSDTESS